MAEEEDTELVRTTRRVNSDIHLMYKIMEIMSLMSTEELNHGGHKSLADGLLYTFNTFSRKIKGIWEEHNKKFPNKRGGVS